MAYPQIFAFLLAAFVFRHADCANGDWRLQYPPWGESGYPTSGSPEIWFPLIGPFTRHSCFPSRYMSMRIAVSHINRRDPTFCPAIATLQNNFQFTYTVADSNSNGVGAASAVLKFLGNASKPVKVVLGPNGSGSSRSMSDILAVFSIPHISWASTSASLSNKATYPMFFRSVSPDSLGMKVLSGWLATLGLTKCNVAYFDADFQSGQAQDFIGPAQATHQMEVSSFKMPNSGKGGTTVSATNMVLVKQVISAIRATGVRIALACMLNEEAYDFFRTAYDEGIYAAEGWIWLGTDGLNGGQLAGDVARLKYFAGSVFIQAVGTGPNFGAYADKWAALMPNTARPEFDQFDLCVNSSTDTTGICVDNADFKGWKDSVHGVELVCKGYTGLAYDAAVTLAVAADRMITSGISPQAATAKDWLKAMQDLSTPGFSFDCLTGKVSYNANQERDMPFAFNNWHTGNLNFVEVAKWDGVDGYRWVDGATVMWPSGQTATITSAQPSMIPTGLPPACSAGKVYNNSLLGCVECPAGSFNDATSCVLCYAGKYQNSQGTTECDSCDIGKYSSGRGATQCSDCEIGKFQSLKVGKSCNQCTPGYYQTTVGASACLRCELGQYSDIGGAATCKMCNASMTTSFVGSISIEDCGCPPGSFQQKSSNVCASCPPGMICAFGSDEHAFDLLASGTVPSTLPLVEEGHMTLRSEPMKVFKCLPSEICPGGVPANCKEGRDNSVVSCGRCPPGQVLNGASCGDCTWWDNSVFFVFVVLSIIACFVGYYAVSSKLTAKLTTMISITMIFGNLVSLVQTLGIFSLLSTPWPKGFREFLEAMSIFTADFDVLSIGCAFGDASTSTHYAISVVFFPFLVITLLIQSMVSRFFPNRWKWTKWNTLNVMGALLQVCFTSMCGVGTSAFVFFEHPMGDWGVTRYPDILTSDGKYVGVILFGCLMIVMSMSYYILCMYLLYLAPTQAAKSNAQFLQACRFLLIRFRVDVWHWALHLMARALLISLCPIVATGEPRAQMLLICLVLSISMLLTARYRPWRAPSLNLVDISICLVLMLLVITATAFIGASTGGWLDVFKALLWVWTGAALFILGLMCVLTIISVVRNGPFGTIHDIVCQQCQRTPDPAELATAIAGMSKDAQLRSEKQIEEALKEMQVFDLWALSNALNIMKESSILKAEKGQSKRQMSVRLSQIDGSFSPGDFTAGQKDLKIEDTQEDAPVSTC